MEFCIVSRLDVLIQLQLSEHDAGRLLTLVEAQAENAEQVGDPTYWRTLAIRLRTGIEASYEQFFASTLVRQGG